MSQTSFVVTEGFSTQQQNTTIFYYKQQFISKRLPFGPECQYIIFGSWKWGLFYV